MAVVTGCLALLAPIWIVRYPPFLDYPNHLASGFVLAHLYDPRFRFSELYTADWSLSPYVATDATVVALLHLLPIEAVGRILLSIGALGLPLAVWLFIRQVRPEDDVAVLWAFAFAYNTFFLFGFLQYSLSIAGCFAVLALWLRYLDRPSSLRWIGLLAAVVALYSVHIFGFAMAGLIITVYALGKRLTVKQLCFSWMAFLPGFLMFLRSPTDVNAGHHIVFGGLARKVAWLLAWLEVHPQPIAPANLVVFALLAISLAVPVWKHAELRWHRDWSKVAAVLLGMYWVLPSGYEGGSYWIVDSRLLPFLFVVALVAVDAGRYRRWAATLAIIVFVVRMASLTSEFLDEQPRLVRLARAFEVVPAGARIVPMVKAGARFPSMLFWPAHFWSYGVIQRGWLSPYLFTLQGVQTLRLRHKPYPDAIEVFPETEPLLDWDRVRRTYDYVWAYRLRHLSPKFQAIGELVFDDEELQVFRMNPGASARAPASRPLSADTPAASGGSPPGRREIDGGDGTLSSPLAPPLGR